MVELRPGTNVVRAFALDTQGNKSPTQSVRFDCLVGGRLLVEAAGRGFLSPNYSNAVLEIGRNYRMTATGVNGHTFAHWVISTNWAGGAVVTMRRWASKCNPT